MATAQPVASIPYKSRSGFAYNSILSRFYPIPLILCLFRYLPPLSPFPPFTKRLADVDYVLNYREKAETRSFCVQASAGVHRTTGSCSDMVILAKMNIFNVKLVSSSGTCACASLYSHSLLLLIANGSHHLFGLPPVPICAS
jgi:hypothetical protein